MSVVSKTTTDCLACLAPAGHRHTPTCSEIADQSVAHDGPLDIDPNSFMSFIEAFDREYFGT